jgi:hypothetical protein
MANEITFSSRMAWARGGESVALSAGDTYTQIGNAAYGAIQLIGLTSVAVYIAPAVTDPCFIGFRNEAPKANTTTGIPVVTVYIGVVTPMTNLVASIALDGGQGIVVPNGGVVWYAIATAANTPLAVAAIDR